MYEFSREVLRYEVRYTDPDSGILRTHKIPQVERAIDIAREKMDKGIDVDIFEIVNLIGWY